MSKTKQPDAIRTYEIVTDHDGTYELEVPDSYRVTFAPVFMGDKGYGGGKKEMALRFYEAENKQRAIFVGVKSFRDLSLPLKKTMAPLPQTAQQKQEAMY